ncbi:adenosylmethionine--8-amino-7-oxononanoate transaminase [Nocardioides sp. Bht2]|uniref:adenosylmethionine--8-amino-7-oxononanoate transaminase n=1 Tax=Nocardioides sp. Bht2 TaxID=3392297 RepID=UPI0039B47A61
MHSDSARLLLRDRELLWHPYASLTEPGEVRLVTGADGVHLELADGGRAIDAMSSWWATVHGHNHPRLNQAITDQLGRDAHTMFGGLTHAPAIELAERLVALSPDGLDHVFLADSGSVSIEVALKMALQYQRGRGRPRRTRILALRGGYHGDTFGAMSVCDPVAGMHAMFSDVLAAQLFADRPPPADASAEQVEGWSEGFRRLAGEHRDELAAIVVEPLLQGAGGMHTYPAACLRVMREVADDLGLLLIFDEIATGFGRTGTLFAADAAHVEPDLMCVGKALSGGYLTLAAVLCTSEVAHGLAASESGVLMHGPTFMANPLACAVAIASIDLLIERDWRLDVARINHGLRSGLEPLRTLPGVVDVRTLGAVGVVQLDHPVDIAAATDAALAEGVWIRPFRDLIYTMPPYITGTPELDQICAAIGAATEVAR